MNAFRVAFGAAIVWSIAASVSADEALTETQKIEALIRHVEELKDAVFVRNGKEYDSRTAAEFLRSKWKAQKKEIRTARDFIEKAATKSSTTGMPYLIRRKDGAESKSGDYLRRKLERLEEVRPQDAHVRCGWTVEAEAKRTSRPTDGQVGWTAAVRRASSRRQASASRTASNLTLAFVPIA